MNNKLIVVSGKHKHEIEVGNNRILTVWKLGTTKHPVSAKDMDSFVRDLQYAVETGNHLVVNQRVKVEQIVL